jgi:lipid-binding SYLF domain-containing protein
MRGIKGVLIAGVIFSLATISYGESRRTLAHRIGDAARYVEDIMEAPDTAIPQELLSKCRGVIILRQYRAGFIFGVKGGRGIALARDEQTKEWSPPAFIRSGSGSYGFQIGGQAVDTIFLIMNRDGMNMLMKTNFKVGVDASIAAGPLGRDAEAKVGPGSAILVYSRAKGLYAGASFEGGLLLNDEKANDLFYGKTGLSGRSILFQNAVPMPPEAEILISLLKKYETLGK